MELGPPASYLYAWYGPRGQSTDITAPANGRAASPSTAASRCGAPPTSCPPTTWPPSGRWLAGARSSTQADTAQFLEWASLPRYEGSEMITPRLPRRRRHRGAQGGMERRPHPPDRWRRGHHPLRGAVRHRHLVPTQRVSDGLLEGRSPDWGRYATCEIYNVIAGTEHQLHQVRRPQRDHQPHHRPDRHRSPRSSPTATKVRGAGLGTRPGLRRRSDRCPDHGRRHHGRHPDGRPTEDLGPRPARVGQLPRVRGFHWSVA